MVQVEVIDIQADAHPYGQGPPESKDQRPITGEVIWSWKVENMVTERSLLGVLIQQSSREGVVTSDLEAKIVVPTNQY